MFPQVPSCRRISGFALILALFLVSVASAQPFHKITSEGNRFMLENLSTAKKKPFDMWVSRLANALVNTEFTDQIVANLDDYQRYGVNTFVVSLQGANLGQGKNGLYPRHYNTDGTLDLQSPLWTNLERLLRETDKRGMVLILQYWYSLRAYLVPDDGKALDATRRVTQWLKDRKYKHYILDVVNEVPHDAYGSRPIFITIDVLKVIDAVKSVNPDLLVGVSPTSQLMCLEGWLDNPRRWVESDIIIGHNQVLDPLLPGAYKFVAPSNPGKKPYINNEFWAQINYEKDLRQNPRDENLYNFGRYDQNTVTTYLADLVKLRGYGGYGGIHSFHQQRIPYLPAQGGPTAPVALVGPEGTQPEASMGSGEPSLHWLYRGIARIQKFGPLPTHWDFNEFVTGFETNLGGDWKRVDNCLAQTNASANPAYARMVADYGDLEIAFDARFLADPGPNGRCGIHLGGATLKDPAYRLSVGRDRITLDQVAGSLPSRTVLTPKRHQDPYCLRILEGRLQVDVNGTTVLDVADVSPIGRRNLLFFTQGATASFDNVRVTPLRLTNFEDGTSRDWKAEQAAAWAVVNRGSGKCWRAIVPASETRRALLDQRIADFSLDIVVDLSQVPGTVLQFRAADLTKAGGIGYYLEVNRDGTVTLERQGDVGPRVNLGSVKSPLQNPASVAVRVKVEGNRIAVHCDGKKLLDVVDVLDPLDRGGLALLARPGTTWFDDIDLRVGPNRFPIARFHPFTGPALPRGFTIEFGDPDGILDLANLSLQVNTGGSIFVDITFVLFPWFSVFGFNFTPDGRSVAFDLNSTVPLGPVNWTFRAVTTDLDGKTTISDLKVQ